MYKPKYPILKREDCAREIIVNPDLELDPFSLAELKNLRRGVSYKMVLPDTPESREALYLKTGYFQLVAFAEGWEFDPEMYQVLFLEPSHCHSLFQDSGNSEMKRIYQLRAGNRDGFRVTGTRGHRMQDAETDSIASLVDALMEGPGSNTPS